MTQTLPHHGEEVLRLLGDETLSGRELRDRLNKGRWWLFRFSGPAFYFLMEKLTCCGAVTYEDQVKEIDGVPFNTRYYRAGENS
jgi:hypothetical protein